MKTEIQIKVNKAINSSQSEQFSLENDYINTLVKSTSKTDCSWVRKTLWDL